MNHSAPPSNGASNSTSQQPSLRTLRGTQPGLLDPTQPSRILRFPDSKLFFASFDPKTALVEDPSIQKLNISENLTPPKRIVVETTPKGTNFWRFVPRARLEEGTQDEGVWPRVVDICGEKVQCFQEQWEIYKLDPAYRCVVYPWPKYSAIVKVELANQPSETADPSTSKRTQRPSPGVGESSPQKRARSRHVDQDEDLGTTTDEDELEEMMVDESVSQKPKFARRPDRTSREKIKKERLHRWARHRMAQEKRFQAPPPPPSDGSFSMRVDTEDTFPSQHAPSQHAPSQHAPSQAADNTKRKDNQSTDGDDGAERIFGSRFSKRPRTLSPEAARGGVHKAHAKFEKKKSERLRQYDRLNREAARRRLYEPRLFSSVPPVHEVDEDEEEEDEDEDEEDYGDEEDGGDEDNEPEVDTPEAKSQSQAGPDERPSNPESSTEAEIAESIRKLRELERDRPLWEAQRKKREARERAEEEERRQKAEAARRRLEEEQRFIRKHLAEQERLLEEAEARRRMYQEEQLRQRANHQRRQRDRWESGIWTTHRALERYRMLSDEFDAAKFAPEQPVTFQDIPWPVLHPPSRLTVEDIDWSAVESFFATVKSHMRLQDYKDFVEKSHRRFHPDRWRARKLWAAVTDEVERSYLEVAANTVAQALTPIWRAARDK